MKLLCPRCGSEDVFDIYKSPGAWALFGCRACGLVWRSTEAREMLTKIPKVTNEDLDKLWLIS